MSSTPRSKKQQSILSFFNKTPKSNKKPTPTGLTDEKENQKDERLPEPSIKPEVKIKSEATPLTPVRAMGAKLKRVRMDDDDEEEEPVARPRKKKRAVIESDSEDESPKKKVKKKKDDSDYEEDMETEQTQESEPEPSGDESEMSDQESYDESPKKSTKKSKQAAKSAPKKSNASMNVSTLASFAADNDDNDDDGFKWEHEKQEWLKPEKITDKNGNRPGSEDYDPTTLRVPIEYINSKTPGMGNWWKIKAANYDTVIFYKVGKFYELYHMDATVGVQVAGLTYMKGAFAHSGFPEMRFDHFSGILLDNGYKVARVEQTETQEQMKERLKRSEDWHGKKKKLDKFTKQTRREVCRVETPGTRMVDFSPSNLEPSEKQFAAIFEETGTIGVCMVDASSCSITLGEFTDDIYFKNLRTLLAHRPVAELVVPTKISDSMKEIVRNSINELAIQYLPEKKFSPKETVEKIIRETESEDIKLDGLLSLVREKPVAARATGAIINQLKRSQILHEILRTVDAKPYVPPSCVDYKPPDDTNRRMILDSMTLTNLDIISS